MPAKKIIVAFVIIIVAIGGFVAGLTLLKQRQDIREEAAVPTGQAEVSINPATGTFQVGQTIETNVSFNTANIPVSGVAIRLTYPFTGSTPEVTVTSIDINSAFTSSGDWTCPTKSNSQQGGNVVIDIACANTSASGFTSNSDTQLAKIKLQVNKEPTNQPLVLRFDPALSVITRKSDNQDILLIPTSTGSFTIGSGGIQPTSTVTPTIKLSGTPTPSPKITATKTPTASPSGTTKGGEELPEAGVSYPTVFGIGLGVMVIVGAALLAL